MPDCTWVDCTATATCPQLDKGGSPWANLCDAHHVELDNAINNFAKGVTDEPKKMLSCWVKAQGGAKKAAERM